MSGSRTTFTSDQDAHRSAEGSMEQERPEDGMRMRVVSPVARMTRGPDDRARQREALFGSAITVLDRVGGHAFARSDLNEYFGYFAMEDLGPWQEPTHRVSTRVALAFGAPDIKCPEAVALSFGSLVSVSGRDGKFLRTPDKLYVPEVYLSPLDRACTDPAGAARLLLSAPYLWGGNSVFGLDCSGLVQIAMNACGWKCPGDSDLQEKMGGTPLSEGTEYRSGDLVFWKGHVGIATEKGTLIHSNAHHMMVVEEPLDEAVARIDLDGGGTITSRLRPRRIPLHY